MVVNHPVARRPILTANLLLVGTLAVISASCSTTSSRTTNDVIDRPPPIGRREKIRFFRSQWWHFSNAKVSDEDLFDGLSRVGATVFLDHGYSAERAKQVRARGIAYFFGTGTAQLRGHAEALKTRLAIDKTGRTCQQRFEAYVKAGGDPNKPWGDWGEGKAAYVPCPLEPGPWQRGLVEPTAELAQKRLIDGLLIDFEPYGAYGFDQGGEMLCYCDVCFSEYLNHKGFEEQVARADRYAWLGDRQLIDDYLARLRRRLTEMFRELAAEIRGQRTDFTFSGKPDFVTEDLRRDWRPQAMALGLSSPEAPYIVVNATAYWEDPTRPWWDGPAAAYRRMGLRHVLGSWDVGLMGSHNESHVGASKLMYESAMGTDGFWRWGEHNYGTDDWRSFALANQHLRQVESRLGDYLFAGREVEHFVTLVEQTGNPFLDRALLARTWEHGGRHLTWVFNGNTDWPVHVRVRFPFDQGEGHWRLRDPLYDVDYAPLSGHAWSAAALRDGVVVPLEGRDELFLLLEKAPAGFRPERFHQVPSMVVAAHRARPATPDELPPADATVGPAAVVYCGSKPGGYTGETAGFALVTAANIADVDANSSRGLFGLQGYVRQPQFSPDGKHVACSVYVNGRGQIYLINAADGKARNLSDNEHCDRSPTFTPDGKAIVYVSDESGEWEIHSMNIDGSDQRRLTASPGVDRSPAVSPDGKHIAFISNRRGDFDVYVMNIDGSGQRVLVPRSGNEYEPTWSPDGSLIACSVQRRQNRCIQLVGPDGRDPYFIALGFPTNLRSIRFSPDGRQMAAAFSSFGLSGLLTVDVEARVEPGKEDWHGKMIQKLVSADSVKAKPNTWYSTGTGRPRMVARTFSGVSYSPDGKMLIYASDQGEDGQFMLYTIPTIGGEPSPVEGTAGAWPINTDWSPR